MTYVLLTSDPEDITVDAIKKLRTDTGGMSLLDARKLLREQRRLDAISFLQTIVEGYTDIDDLRNVLHDTLELLRTA